MQNELMLSEELKDFQNYFRVNLKDIDRVYSIFKSLCDRTIQPWFFSSPEYTVKTAAEEACLLHEIIVSEMLPRQEVVASKTKGF